MVGVFVLLMGLLTPCAFFVAIWSDSIVLLLNSFVLLHRLCILMSLLAGKLASTATISTLPAAVRYSFGLTRLETLCHYASLCILLFSCLTTIVKALESLFSPHDVHPIFVEMLCSIHIILVVSVALFVRADEVALARRKGGRKAVALFLLAEVISPIFGILSTQLVYWSGESRIDIVAALILTVITVVDASEELESISAVMLQRSPPQPLKGTLDRAAAQISILPGVLQVLDMKSWVLTHGHLVVTLRLRLSKEATDGPSPIGEQKILAEVNQIMAPLVHSCTVQMERYNSAPLIAAGPVMEAPIPGHSHSHGHLHDGDDHGHSHHHGAAIGARSNSCCSSHSGDNKEDSSAYPVGSGGDFLPQHIPLFAPTPSPPPLAGLGGIGGGRGGDALLFPLPPPPPLRMPLFPPSAQSPQPQGQQQHSV